MRADRERGDREEREGEGKGEDITWCNLPSTLMLKVEVVLPT